jgi:hypothetical protein
MHIFFFLISAAIPTSLFLVIYDNLPVLWIRIGFKGDPVSAFYIKAAADPGRQTNSDPDPGQL